MPNPYAPHPPVNPYPPNPYAGLNPYLIGVDQINITVPPTLTSGDYPITLYVGGNKSNTPLLKVVHP